MTRLRCPNGHEWEAPAGGPGAAGGAGVPCPVCGSLDRTLHTPPTLPHDLDRARLAQLGTPPDPGKASSSSGGLIDLSAPHAAPAIAGYEVLEELGRGGMSIVYRARQVGRERVVALKVIRKERLTNPDMVTRFRREAQASARLSHPNVVTVYESDQAGDTHFLAMEYVPGITLQRLVEQSGPLPVALACDFARQTALGLQHAFEQGLVHRDIKPSNLMVVAPAGPPLPPRPVLKILDMGVARLYQLVGLHEESLTTLTRDGAVIGTPDYIAPEQLEDPHAADVRADLYSLGCTLYFLLSGRVPFPGGTLIQKLDRQRWQTPPSVDQLRPDVPPGVAAVVRRLMAKHPDDRYRTPGELVAALEQLVRTGDLPSGHGPAALCEARVLSGHVGPVTALAVSPDGGTLLSGGADRTLRLWDLPGGQERGRLGEARQEVGCACFVPGTGLVLAGQGVTVRAWDPASGREVFRLAGHTDAVRALAVSADGRYAATGGNDRAVRLWDLQTGREVQRLARQRAGVTGVAFSPDGRWLVCAGQDQSQRLWDARAGREVRTFPVPRGPVLGVAFAPDGQGILSGHFDTTLRLWEADTGRELRRFSGHRRMVAAVAFTPDGHAVSGSHDQTVRVWDVGSGSELYGCQGHTGAVLCVAVGPGGRTLASGGADSTIRLWQLPE